MCQAAWAVEQTTWFSIPCFLVLQSEVDYFTATLHIPNSLPLQLCKGTVSGIWKLVEILTGRMSAPCISTPVNPYFIIIY